MTAIRQPIPFFIALFSLEAPDGRGGIISLPPPMLHFPPHEALPGPSPAHPGPWGPQVRPHGHRDALRVRLSDALRPVVRLPPADHQEAAPALDPPRAALVPLRRYQCPLPPRARRDDLGRVGGRRGQPRAGLRRPVALLAGAGRRLDRPDLARRRADPHPPRLAPPHRERLERRRPRRHGSPSLPRPVPVLGRRGAPLMPALPEERRRVPGRAVQHRLLRPADDDGGPGLRPPAGRLRAHAGRRPPLPQPPGAGAAPAHPRAPAAARHDAQPRAEIPVRLPLRGLHAEQLRSAPRDQGADRRMTGSPNERPRVSLIAAMGSNRAIGIDNRLPWRLPADLRRFKALTTGHTLVMGRKTFESIRGPLPWRTTVVVSRRPDYAPEGVLVAHSVEEALARAAEDDEVFIAGGEEIFRQTLERADRMHLTWIEKDFPADAFFPEFDESAWRLVEREDHEATAEAPFAYSFRVYDRIRGDGRG